MNLSKLLIAQSQDEPGWRLNYADHVLANSVMGKNAEEFRNRVWIEKPGERATPMSDLMYQEFELQALQNIVFPQFSGVRALRVYFGFSTETNQIQHFFEPVIIRDPIDAGRGIFDLPLSSPSQFHTDMFDGVLYKIQNKRFVRIDTDSAEMVRFSGMWFNYARYIRFESYLFDAWRLRTFDGSNDTVSCVLPFDIFQDVVADNESQSGFIYSTISLVSNVYRQNVCLTYKKLDDRSKAYSILDVNFRGFSANYSQLCPTRCGKLRATLLDPVNKVYELI